VKFQEYVCVVNGTSRYSDDWPRDTEDVLVINGSSSDDMPSHYTSVYVINRMPRNDWPYPYKNVCFINGISRYSDDWPRHYENVYVVNFEVLREMPSVRKIFYPSIEFVKCPMCFREFEIKKDLLENFLSDFYRCPYCGHSFLKLFAT